MLSFGADKPEGRYILALQGFGLFLFITTLGLITLGGIVHASGSALACPDWPLCEGSAVPPMKGLVYYEHGHRLLGAAVALCTLALVLLESSLLPRPQSNAALRSVFILCLQMVLFIAGGIFYSYKVRAGNLALGPWVLGLGALSVTVSFARIWRHFLELPARPALSLLLSQWVIIQASLGGLTVLLGLPPWVSIAHFTTALLFISTLVLYLSFAFVPHPVSIVERLRRSPIGTTLSAALFIQLLLGAIVRHHGVGLACGPELQWLGCQSNGPWLNHTYWLIIHRSVGIGLALVIVIIALRWLLQHQRRWWAFGILGLTLTQVALGFIAISSYIAIIPVTFHLFVGVSLYLLFWVMALHTTEGTNIAMQSRSQRKPLSLIRTESAMASVAGATEKAHMV